VILSFDVKSVLLVHFGLRCPDVQTFGKVKVHRMEVVCEKIGFAVGDFFQVSSICCEYDDVVHAYASAPLVVSPPKAVFQKNHIV